MTREEFERSIVAGTGLSFDWFRSQGIEACPCDCGEPGCEGWALAIVGAPHRSREMTCLTCGQLCCLHEPHVCPPIPPRLITRTGLKIQKPPTDKSPEGE